VTPIDCNLATVLEFVMSKIGITNGILEFVSCLWFTSLCRLNISGLGNDDLHKLHLYEKICDLCKVETCSYSKSIVVYVFEHTSQGHNLGSGPVKSTVSTLYNKINFSH